MDRLERVIKLRTGGDTERCHGIRHQRSYSVASHTWGVMVLLYVLWPDDYDRLSKYALFHDVPEAWVGDIPATTKRYHSSVRAACSDMERKIFRLLDIPSEQTLVPDDYVKLKACDQLELYLWAMEEIAGGNQHAACIARQLDEFFKERSLPPEANELYLDIVDGGDVEHATDGLIKEILA